MKPSIMNNAPGAKVWQRFSRLSIKGLVVKGLLAMLPLSATAAEGPYVGLVIGGISRGGFIVGYPMTPDSAVELHLGGFSHVMTWGVSIKQMIGSDDNYLLLGFSRQQFMARDSDQGITDGFNIGFGHEFALDDGGRWSFPVEIGGGPAYDYDNQQWMPMFFFGYGAVFNRD